MLSCLTLHLWFPGPEPVTVAWSLTAPWFCSASLMTLYCVHSLDFEDHQTELGDENTPKAPSTMYSIQWPILTQLDVR